MPLHNANSQLTSTLQDIHILAMAWPIETLNMLNRQGHVETGIRSFSALARIKKLNGVKSTGVENEITEPFFPRQDLKLYRKYRQLLTQHK